MPIPLRTDYDAARLRLAARESKDAGQTRRLLALAAIYDGASRTEAAAVGGVTLQIVRDWVLKLNAGGPEALVDYKGPGPQPILTDAHRAVLAQAIEDGPIPRHPRRGPLACGRPGAMAVRRLPGGRVQADAQPRAAPDGVSQALGAPPPPCPGGRRHRRL